MRRECLVFALQALQGGFVLAQLERTCLGEGGEGVINTGDGVFVWLDIEVCEGVADELGGVSLRYLLFAKRSIDAL